MFFFFPPSNNLRGIFYICNNLGSICEEFVLLGQFVVACQFYFLKFHLDAGMLYVPKFLFLSIYMLVIVISLWLRLACVFRGGPFNYGTWVMVSGGTSATKLASFCVVKIKVIWESYKLHNSYLAKWCNKQRCVNEKVWQAKIYKRLFVTHKITLHKLYLNDREYWSSLLCYYQFDEVQGEYLSTKFINQVPPFFVNELIYFVYFKLVWWQ